MANLSVMAVKAYLEAKGFKVDVGGDDEHILVSEFKMENRNDIRIVMDFSADNHDVSIKALDIAEVPESARNAMLNEINSINRDFRWVKFYVDEENKIIAEDDAIIQLDSCAEEVFRCDLQLVSILDMVYPRIMEVAG